MTVVWEVCFYFALLSFFISLRLIYLHLIHFSQPVIQRKIVAILWMVPIYAITSWLSLRFIDASLYFDMIRDSYESIVLYMFFALCYGYIGQIDRDHVDKGRIFSVLSSKGEIGHVFPFNRLLAPIDLRSDPAAFLLQCKRFILQFVVIKPLATMIGIYLYTRDEYTPGDFSINSGYLYLCIMVNLSISLSLYWLVLFYVSTKDALVPYNPVPKFLCIKGVLFFSFWQSVIIVVLHKFGIIDKIPITEYSSAQICVIIQNGLICFEMLIAAIVHSYVFPSTPFELLVRPSLNPRRLLTNALDLNDVVRDFNEVSPLLLPSTSFRRSPPTLSERPPTSVNKPLITVPSSIALNQLVK